jgi:hypothetical protein
MASMGNSVGQKKTSIYPQPSVERSNVRILPPRVQGELHSEFLNIGSMYIFEMSRFCGAQSTPGHIVPTGRESSKITCTQVGVRRSNARLFSGADLSRQSRITHTYTCPTRPVQDRSSPGTHLSLDRSPNIGPLISRWELDKFKNC